MIIFEFLRSQADIVTPRFLDIVRSRLLNPAISAEKYILELASRQLMKTASFLQDNINLI